MDDSAKQVEPAAGARGSFNDRRAVPREVKVRLQEQRIIIEWQDGSRNDLPVALLRRHCPCATCRTNREQQAAQPLRILAFDPAAVRVTSAKLVGNYGIQPEWSDGHNTGIFDFRLLRELADGVAKG